MVLEYFDLVCPVGNELFQDPVRAEDGRTYSRVMIEAWFKSQLDQGLAITSPWTREVIGQTLVPDEEAATNVEEYNQAVLNVNPANAEDLRSVLGGTASIHDLREVFAALDQVRPILVDSLKEWKPPQLVMIGQEKSGKSSVLERLAMMSIFPRDDETCTRLPIHVRLRFSEVCRPATLEVLNLTTKETEGPFVIPTATGAIDVRNKMTEILEKEKAELSQTRIIILTVCSPNVACIDLVDMPGLVTTPPELKTITRALVDNHIQEHGKYSLYLATVPAYALPNSSAAMDVVQAHNLESKTIGVFTMCDEVPPRLWDSAKGFMTRITAPDTEGCGGVPLHPHGWVGVVNAAVKEGENNLAKLAQQAANEEHFMQAKMRNLVQDGKAGSAALVAKVNKLFMEFLTQQWGPQTVCKLNSAIAEAQLENALLGWPEFNIDEKEACPVRQCAVEDARKRIESGTPLLIKEASKVLQQLKAELMSLDSGAQTLQACLAIQTWQQTRNAVQEKCYAAIATWDSHPGWVEGMKGILDRRESEGKPKDELISQPCFELYRFPSFTSSILKKLGSMLPDVKKGIQKAVDSCLEDYFSLDHLSSSVSISCDLSTDTPLVSISCQHLKLVDYIMFAFIKQSSSMLVEELPKCLDALGNDISDNEWIEACATERDEVLSKLDKLRSAKGRILEILRVNSKESLRRPSGFDGWKNVVVGNAQSLHGLTVCGSPRGIAVDPDGQVFVSDFESSTVRVFLNGTQVSSFAVPGNPRALALDSQADALYVSCDSSVYVMTKDGTPKCSFGGVGILDPSGIAVGSKEVFVVAAKEGSGCGLAVFSKPRQEKPAQLIRNISVDPASAACGRQVCGMALHEEAGLLYLNFAKPASDQVWVVRIDGAFHAVLQISARNIAVQGDKIFIGSDSANEVAVYQRDAELKHTHQRTIALPYCCNGLYVDENCTLLTAGLSEAKVDLRPVT